MNKPSLSKSLLISTLFSLAVGLISCQPTQQSSDSSSNLPPEEVTIRSAHSIWIEESFQTAIVNIGLEKLGYQIDSVKELEYPGIYLSLANGDLDYSVIYYSPSHQTMFDQAGGDEILQRLGVLVPIGSRGYQIDKKTAEEYGITNLEQFQDPAIAALFDMDRDGKADLAGCNPGWTCESVINHHIETYGLQETVEQNQGNFTALLADVITRYEEGQSVMFYSYTPHWMSAVLRPDQEVIWLEVPFTSIPDNPNITEEDTTFNGKNVGFAGGGQEIVANKEFADANPVAKHWLESVQMSLEDMNEVSLRIKEGENTPEDIRRLAQEWVSDNQEQFDRWIAEAKAAGE
ncbi:glycine betaine/L-proline ABC transporter substrate-binding protein ProX [Roseofilum sp. BLCC_M154]|uniref:Glycine betaine/L-proline ABC transporter substrate-binding protein ProX n=1 Tax=Roseofilum acuticapitatum BLCC-M154 TaxID=3022444 RepID=A0ABT7AVD2_9CYAN|nr:glycine betaine/L-proline ABC transporter substrate-binding protein ProX [Roseofilum acuticapitatum]MDJ1170878.1 glycine betaine/L-proline ABC transporter substrate-binding protein ProX [Roseofilum acuticapitatum BLCC-M154]